MNKAIQMLDRGMAGAKDFKDTDRMKSFFYLTMFTNTVDDDMKAFIQNVPIAAASSYDVTSGKLGSPQYSALDSERIRRMDNYMLQWAFDNQAKIVFRCSSEELIYKQLLLDCMDAYIDYAYDLPDDIEWPFMKDE